MSIRQLTLLISTFTNSDSFLMSILLSMHLSSWRCTLSFLYLYFSIIIVFSYISDISKMVWPFAHIVCFAKCWPFWFLKVVIATTVFALSVHCYIFYFVSIIPYLVDLLFFNYIFLQFSILICFTYINVLLGC